VSHRHAIGRLCVITDTTAQKRFNHVQLAELAARGGADIIQLRDKDLTDDALIPIAIDMKRVCEPHGAKLIVNDRIAVARAAGAHGVHLGREDVAIAEARRLLGPDSIIGATAHSLAEAMAAEASPADYIGFGHIVPTTSKARTTTAVGVDELARVCAAVSLPVFAIGGITHARITEIMAAGAWGVAVIAAVCTAEDPGAATRQLHDAIVESRGGQRGSSSRVSD
jgi:thiamine-phosphate pyrophosphorylase